MTIEKANKDFNQLVEQSGFTNTGAITPTGCEVYSREWNRKVQVAWYSDSADTLAIKIWICLAGGTIYVIENAVSPAAKETGYEKLKRMVLNAPEFNEKKAKIQQYLVRLLQASLVLSPLPLESCRKGVLK